MAVLSNGLLACIIHENYIFIHKRFKAKGFEFSTRLQKNAGFG